MRISTVDMQRTSLNAILDAQNKLSKLQEQISTGKRILKPSDDPVSMDRISAMHSSLDRIETYRKNMINAKAQLSLEESSLSNVTDTVVRINELQKQALNGVLTANDRSKIADEMEALLGALVAQANTQDENGEYIFAGYQSSKKPYYDHGDSVVYAGDQGQRMVQIGTSAHVIAADSGYQVFEDIKNGNGTFVTGEGLSSNAGSARISNGSVVDGAAYVPETYTIAFVMNGSSNIAYTVTGSVSGQLVPTPPDTVPLDAPDFVEGSSINFNGIEVSITGKPQVGDDFTIEPSQNQSLFNTIKNMIAALRAPQISDADLARSQNALQREGAALDNGLNKVMETLTKIGVRTNFVENTESINQDIKTQNQTVLSNIEEIDFVEALSKLNLQLTALQTAQQSYIRMQNLSMFDYM